LLPAAVSAGPDVTAAGVKTAIALPVDYSGSQPGLAERTVSALVRNYAAVHAQDGIIRLRGSREEALIEAREAGATDLIITEVLHCAAGASRTITLELALFALDVKSGNVKAASFSAGNGKVRPGGSTSANLQIDEALDRALRAAIAELDRGKLNNGRIEACLSGEYKLNLQSPAKEGVRVASFNGTHANGIMKIRSAGRQETMAELVASFSTPQQGDAVLVQTGDVSTRQNNSGKSKWVVGALVLLGAVALSGNGSSGSVMPADEDLTINIVPGNGVVHLNWSSPSQNPDAYVIYRRIAVATSSGTGRTRAGRTILRQARNVPVRVESQEEGSATDRPSSDKQGYERLTQTTGNVNSYDDYSVVNGSVYEYGVAYIKNGVESRLSVCSRRVCPDGSLPVVTIMTGPADGSVIDYSDVTFTWQGEDAVTSPDNIRFAFCLDGDLPVNYANDRSISYTGLADGVHEFSIRAVDEAGNVGATVNCSFTVTTGSQERHPEVTIESVTPNPTAGSQTVTVIARAVAFDGTEIAAGYVIADNPLIGGPGWGALSVSRQQDGSYRLEGTYDVSELSEGLHNIYVRAVDSRDLCTVSLPFSLQVSGVNPPPAQLVPDSGLREAILAKLGFSADHELTVADLQGMSGELSAYSRSITNLDGIQHCTGLTRLIIYSNSITDISKLQSLTAIQILDLGDNTVTDISALQNMTAIGSLSLENNRVTDISPLVANSGLAGGDSLSLKGNLLDFSGIDKPARIAVNTLRGRGASVDTGLGGISGTLTDLSGVMGHTRVGAFKVEGFNAQNPGLPVNGIVDPPATGAYELRDLPAGNYYVGAFVDIDNDGLFEPGDGEPGAWYGGGSQTALDVSASSSPSGIHILIPAP